MKKLILFTILIGTQAFARPTLEEAVLKLKAKYALIDKKQDLKAQQKAELEALKEKQKAEREALAKSLEEGK